MNLQNRQLAMKVQQKKKSAAPGPRAGETGKMELIYNSTRVQRRCFCYMLIQKGWSLSRVACEIERRFAGIRCSVEWLQQWQADGYPLESQYVVDE